MAQRNEKGQFVKGNNVRGIHKQKEIASQRILDETARLHQQIYNESLKQLLEAVQNGEIGTKDLITLANNVSEHVASKKARGEKAKKAPKLRGNIEDIKDLLGE